MIKTFFSLSCYKIIHYIQVVYDRSIKEKLGGEDAVIAYWNAAEPHLQAKFCHNSLGTKIKAERVSAFEYFNEKIVASQSGLNTVMDNAKSVIGNADLVVYMANDENGQGEQFFLIFNKS